MMIAWIFKKMNRKQKMNDASRLDLLEIRARFHKYNEYSKVYYVFLSFSYIFRIQVSILRLNIVSLSFKSVHVPFEVNVARLCFISFFIIKKLASQKILLI